MQFSGNTSTLNVEISDKSGIAISTAVNYIKSGEKEIENAVTDGITQFNTNATAKTTAYNQNAAEKTTAYNENATAKLSAYNENDAAKTTAYDNNAAAKLNAYNENDTVKTTVFNTNATEKTTAFNANATSKTADFNTNASDKTTAFDNNASAKTTAFNDNATEKQAAVDASATAAAASAATSKQWAVGEPTEPTGNSSKYWAQSAAASASNMANRDLSNLSSDGQMIVDSVNGTISNCVLEIPQNLKLTLENNVLTLKSGSECVVYGSTYQTVTKGSDLTRNFSNSGTNRTIVIMPNTTLTYMGFLDLSHITSGESFPSNLPSSGQYGFYKVSEKQLYETQDGGTTWSVSGRTYPICIINIDSNGVASFAKDSNGNDMIFNGAGFIGHHAFVYPNVSVFYPNGYSDVKHLNSVKITTNQLYITELATNRNCLAISAYTQQVTPLTRGADLNDKNLITNNNEYHYITTENYVYSKISSGYVQRPLMFFVDYTYNGTTVTDFTIRQPIRLATTEMLNNGLAQKQDTLVSGTNIKTINSTSVLGSGNFTLADQSLSNLDSNGQRVVDSQNGTISNCILDIPQNLKLEFSNGTVTLKAGSVIVLTGGTYSTVTTTQDVTWNSSTQANTKQYLFITKYGFAGGLYGRSNLNKAGSGPNLPVDSSTYLTFFNTTDKIIYQWNPYTSQWESTTLCYPLGIIEIDSQGNITGFAKDSNGNDMIFNGCGFIGHHRFVYPNVKCLFAAGKDSNGKLLSNVVITNGLLISGNTTQSRSVFYLFSPTSANAISPEAYYYSEAENLWRRRDDNNVLNTCVLATTTGNVDSMTIRQPVRIATVEMLKDKQNKLTFDTAPTSNSTNPVTSGGVYTALAAKADDNAVVHLAENETITGNKTFSGTNTFVTPAVSDNSQKPATTAYVNNKFQVVSALPASPDANTFYFIEES